MKTITYRATNKNNGKWYVGSTTKSLNERMKGHLDPRISDEFHNTLRKRPDTFFWEVLSEVDGEDRSHEQEILDVWCGTKFCYNIRPHASGGDPGVVHVDKDDFGRSLHAVNTLGPFFADPEHQRVAAIAAHSEKDEQGRSLLAMGSVVKVHDDKDEWGRSKHGVARGSQSLNPAKQWLFTDPETGEEFGPFPSSSIASAQMGIKKHTIKNRANTGKLTEGYIITSY